MLCTRIRRMRVCLIVFVAASISSYAQISQARTWHVKVDGTGDAPTIHSAVDSTSPGDTILVAPGSYTWTNQGTGTEFGLIEIPATRVDFVLMSEGGPEVTILDAEGQGRVIFIAGLNFMTLDGFTITGGLAPSFGDFAGGGIAMHLSHDLIKNCIIVDNQAEFGAGMWCGGVSSPVLENVIIKDNTANYGGGILFVNSSLLPILTNVVIHDNLARINGGGIYAFNNGIRLENTIIARNRAFGIGGGIYSVGSEKSYLVGCTIVANRAPTSGFLHIQSGAGFFIGRCIVASTMEGTPIRYGGGHPSRLPATICLTTRSPTTGPGGQWT